MGMEKKQKNITKYTNQYNINEQHKVNLTNVSSSLRTRSNIG